MMVSYVSIDLGTTGLNPRLDKIIEIGAVKVKEGRLEETFSTLVNPARLLGEKISGLTGIKDEMLLAAPEIEEVMPKLLEFLEDYPLLGHSVLFDFSFLKKAAVNQRLSFERNAVDTLKIARKHLSFLEHRNLKYLCEYYGIEHEAHRALSDAEATVSLYEKLAEQFYTEEETLFRPCALYYEAKRDTPATNAQKERLYRLINRHKLIVSVNVDKLSRSEASRLTDKILSEYGR